MVISHLITFIFDEGKLIGCIEIVLERDEMAETDTQDLPSYGTASVNFVARFLQKRLFQKYGIDNPDMNKLQFHLMLDEFF